MSKLTPTELVDYIMSMNAPEMDAYAVTLRNAISLGADLELCLEGTRTIMRERFRRASELAKEDLRTITRQAAAARSV